ncbi:MAG: hypothetical protein KC503_07325, partial [Myxococcales bacterium]|nr:hypothetical protein [Myxococcales bacterium]
MRWTRRAVTAGALLVCAATLLVWLLRQRGHHATTTTATTAVTRPSPIRAASDGVRLRGFVSSARARERDDTEGERPALRLYRRRTAGEPERLRDGTTTRAGDVVQLVYRAGRARHGAIISHDGRGHVTLHYPARREASTHLARGMAQPLPYAFELDDAPRFERFLFVVADAPLDVGALLAR